jgi:hypothetical protein
MASDRKNSSCNESWGAVDDYLLESSESRDGNDSDDAECSDQLESSKSRDGNDSDDNDDEASEWDGSSIKDERELDDGTDEVLMDETGGDYSPCGRTYKCKYQLYCCWERGDQSLLVAFLSILK